MAIPEQPQQPQQPSQPTRAYGAVEHADDTRQAQHTVANDAPVDVNLNAVVARSQALTFDEAGRAHTSAAERRQMIADAYMGKSMDKATA